MCFQGFKSPDCNLCFLCLLLKQKIVQGVDVHRIRGLGFDATCSLVVLDKQFHPLPVNLEGRTALVPSSSDCCRRTSVFRTLKFKNPTFLGAHTVWSAKKKIHFLCNIFSQATIHEVYLPKWICGWLEMELYICFVSTRNYFNRSHLRGRRFTLAYSYVLHGSREVMISGAWNSWSFYICSHKTRARSVLIPSAPRLHCRAHPLRWSCPHSG